MPVAISNRSSKVAVSDGSTITSSSSTSCAQHWDDLKWGNFYNLYADDSFKFCTANFVHNCSYPGDRLLLHPQPSTSYRSQSMLYYSIQQSLQCYKMLLLHVHPLPLRPLSFVPMCSTSAFKNMLAHLAQCLHSNLL